VYLVGIIYKRTLHSIIYLYFIPFYTLLYRLFYGGCFTFIFNYTLQPFKAYCAIWVRRSTFRHQASPRMSPRESTQRRKVELWARNVREFCLNTDFHVTFRDLLHAVKLRHGTDGFTSPPKEGVLRNFSPPKKTEGFGREKPANFGYQRPARYL